MLLHGGHKSIKIANFRWIFQTDIGFVGMSGVDIYVGRDLKCRGPVSLQQSDLISGYINTCGPRAEAREGAKHSTVGMSFTSHY